MSYTHFISQIDGTVFPDHIIRDSDGVIILENPEDPAWLAYQDWLQAGNQPSSGTPPVIPPPVTQVTAAQAKVALFKQGLLTQVEALIASYPPEAKIWYDNANVWDRTNPYNQGISMALGLTPEAEDALWALAAIQ